MHFFLDKVDQYILDQSNIKLPDNKNEDYYYINTNFNKLNKNKHCSLFPTKEQIQKMDLEKRKNEIYFAI